MEKDDSEENRKGTINCKQQKSHSISFSKTMKTNIGNQPNKMLYKSCSKIAMKKSSTQMIKWEIIRNCVINNKNCPLSSHRNTAMMSKVTYTNQQPCNL